MLLIRKQAFARAGLIGNPSDGYHGKTISITVRNFRAEVVLYEWDKVEVVWSQEDRSRFRSLDELVDDVRLHGYYGGVRLVKATIKTFVEYCRRQGHALHQRNFSIRYQSDIPRQVGLAGSSAIIVATLRCLMEFFAVQIPLRVQPSLALSVEMDELGIAAGLQDRVIQVYEGIVAMDFSREKSQRLHGYNCGVYESLDPGALPPLYLAYNANVAGPTEVTHDDLRARYDAGDEQVIAAMAQFAHYAADAREAIDQGDQKRLIELIDRNYDLRRSICSLPAGQAAMVTRARAAGVSAKFTGSGGAIIGTFEDDAAYARLEHEMEALGCRLIKPEVGQSAIDG